MALNGSQSGDTEYDAQRPNVATGTGRVKPKAKGKKPLSGIPAPGQVPKSGYDWGDGKGDRHTISLGQHNKNVEAKALIPYDIGGGYDPRQVRSTVQGAMDQEYGEPIRQQGVQIADSQRNLDVNIPGWYQQYIDALTAARSASQSTFTGAAATSGMQTPAPTGDATMDQANQVLANGQNGFRDLLNTQGANTTSGYDQNIGNAALMRIGSLQEEGRNKQNLQAGLGQLEKEKGEYGNTYLEKMREAAMGYDTDMAAASAAAQASGAKLDWEKKTFDYNNNGVPDSIEASQGKLDNTVTKWGYTNAEWREMTPDQRESIIASQKPPKAGAKENTKDYYGYTWDQWKNMTPGKRRAAMKAAADAKGGGDKEPTGSAAAQSQFRFALDWYRGAIKKGEYKNGAYTYTNKKGEKVAGDPISTMRGEAKAYGTPIDYQVARILDHWAKNGGKISAEEYDTLRKKGVPENWLKGHIG